MRFSTVVAATALALGVSAAPNGTVVTEVVTEYTTYCPEPTTLTHGDKTYTITEATTITLPCPTGCHVTKTLTSSPAAPTVPAGNSSAPAAPTKQPTAAPPAPTTANPAPPAFTGAASQLVVSGGAMAAVFGIAAYLL